MNETFGNRGNTKTNLMKLFCLSSK